jgi:hypothetical protein
MLKRVKSIYEGQNFWTSNRCIYAPLKTGIEVVSNPLQPVANCHCLSLLHLSLVVNLGYDFMLRAFGHLLTVNVCLLSACILDYESLMLLDVCLLLSTMNSLRTVFSHRISY